MAEKARHPQSEESFQDLYDRARLMEQYEKQHSDTVAVRNESQIYKPKQPTKSPGPGRAKPKGQTQPPATLSPNASPAPLCNPLHLREGIHAIDVMRLGTLLVNVPINSKPLNPLDKVIIPVLMLLLSKLITLQMT